MFARNPPTSWVDDWYSFVSGFSPPMKRLLIVLALLPCIVRADLTASQMSAAMVQALKDYAQYSTGYNFAFMTLPLADWNLNFDIYDGMSDILDNKYFPWWTPFRQSVNSNLASIVKVQNLTAVAATQLASRVSAQLVQKLEDYLDSADWSTLIFDTDGIYSYVQNIDSSLYSLGSALAMSQSDILSALNTFSNSVSQSSSDISSALDTLYSEITAQVTILNSMLTDIDDSTSYLLDIKDNTYDTSTGVEHIFNWLVYSFEGVLVDAFEHLSQDVYVSVTNQFPDRMYVNVENWPSDYEIKGLGAISNLISDISLENLRQGTNIQSIADIMQDEWYPASTNFFASSTNFFVSIAPSQAAISSVVYTTNQLSISNAVLNREVEDIDEQWEDFDLTPPFVEEPSQDSISDEQANVLGLNSIDSTFNHGRTIILTQGSPLYSIPRMEIDLYRNSDLASAFSRIGNAMRVFWTALFALFTGLLYYRSYRKARAMLLASRGFNHGDINLDVGFVADNGDVL